MGSRCLDSPGLLVGTSSAADSTDRPVGPFANLAVDGTWLGVARFGADVAATHLSAILSLAYGLTRAVLLTTPTGLRAGAVLRPLRDDAIDRTVLSVADKGNG